MNRPGCLNSDACRATGDSLCRVCSRIHQDWASPTRRYNVIRANQGRGPIADPEHKKAAYRAAVAARRPMIEARHAEVLRRWAEGQSPEEIARATGYKATTVVQIEADRRNREKSR